MLIREVVISAEMEAAGLEALIEARRQDLPENLIPREIYLAMYGAFIRFQYEPEPLH